MSIKTMLLLLKIAISVALRSSKIPDMSETSLRGIKKFIHSGYRVFTHKTDENITYSSMH